MFFLGVQSFRTSSGPRCLGIAYSHTFPTKFSQIIGKCTKDMNLRDYTGWFIGFFSVASDIPHVTG